MLDFPVNESLKDYDFTGLGQRGIADIIEMVVSKACRDEFMFDELWTYYPARSKRSMEDFSLRGDKMTYWYDVKSHDLNGDFCMPNLISIDRLRRVINDDSQELVYIFVDYIMNDIKEIKFLPIHKISHQSLAIQNLGLGVLQLKNAHDPIIPFEGTKREWANEFSRMAIAFYEKQAKKFNQLKLKWTM